jgi:hypothetical protein
LKPLCVKNLDAVKRQRSNKENGVRIDNWSGASINNLRQSINPVAVRSIFRSQGSLLLPNKFLRKRSSTLPSNKEILWSEN